jgi:L-lactate dehydrogenase complex protein LldG
MAVEATEAPANKTELWEIFQVKATTLGARVERFASERAIAEAIAREAVEVAGTRALARHFPSLSGACTGTVSTTLSPDTALPLEVVTAGQFAVAETGSVAVCEDNAGRAACFLAERLWLVIPEDAIVATLDEAVTRIAGLVHEGAPYVTLMSGPSRTADIERVVTIGVHGPRELVVVVVETERQSSMDADGRGWKPPMTTDDHR